MRVVTSPDFCKVCTEGLWIYLLRHVDLIDRVEQGCKEKDDGSWVTTLNATLVPLAQFRDGEPPNGVKETYTITWLKDGKELPSFTNKTVAEIEGSSAVGAYDLKVQFSTEEVKVDKDGLLKSDLQFNVAETCGENE
jgi:hypothetical protein